jgi:prephenate dehydrogenase
MFKNILIYGFGLMGGSLALAIRKKKLAYHVTGLVRNENTLQEAIHLGFADEFYLESDFLKKDLWNKYDFIVFSLPVDLTCKKISLIPDSYTGILTDLGSTKREIIQAVENRFTREHNYISSHPMTGSENSGARYAKEDLYEGKLCILTSPKRLKTEVKEKIQTFWDKLGSQTIEIPAEDHDEVLAYLSHSPHIISSLLVTWAGTNPKVKEYNQRSKIPLSGGGFRDMSRIAGSNPEMWEAIIHTNKSDIYKSLKEFKIKLEELLEIFEKDGNSNFWKKYFEKARDYRNQIFKL